MVAPIEIGSFDRFRTKAPAFKIALLKKFIPIVQVFPLKNTSQWITKPQPRNSLYFSCFSRSFSSILPFPRNYKEKEEKRSEICVSTVQSDFMAFTAKESLNIGYICVKGPAIITAKHLKLPKGLKCVDPEKYLLTLADDGIFYI